MSQFASSLQRFFKPREVVIVGIVLLLILVSLSLFSLVQMPTLVTSQAQATAEVQMKGISTAYVATSSANNAATATPRARGTATAQTEATATAQVVGATATAIAGANPYPPHNGTLAVDDTLQNNSANYWDFSSGKNGSCQFTGGAYHVKVSTKILLYCAAFDTNFSNFVYQVQMTFVSGDGGGGILFRLDDRGRGGYSFLIFPDGSYSLVKYSSGASPQLLRGGDNAAIKAGLKRTNLLTVIARGKAIDVYVNDKRIDGISDGAFSSGFIAVAADYYTGPCETAFSNAKVWTL